MALLNCINTAITWLLQRQFSGIISNPPYQKGFLKDYPCMLFLPEHYFKKDWGMVNPITVNPLLYFSRLQVKIFCSSKKKQMTSNTGLLTDTDWDIKQPSMNSFSFRPIPHPIMKNPEESVHPNVFSHLVPVVSSHKASWDCPYFDISTSETPASPQWML